MAEEYLYHPLLNTAPTTSAPGGDAAEDDNPRSSSSNTSIISRLLSVIFIGAISIWANFEASKGFDVTIINDSKDSLAGKRFELLYISNDKATRILLNTSAFVENILYPPFSNNYTKKEVHRVILRFASLNNLTSRTIVNVEKNRTNEFIINLSPSVMAHVNVNYEVISALQRGMARIWLWDGESSAPPWLMDGLVEYISMLAGFGEEKVSVSSHLPEFGERCWDDEDARVVALFLDYCEGNNKGFIQRLNQALREQWNYNRTVEGSGALGIEAKYLCDSYKKLHEFSL